METSRIVMVKVWYGRSSKLAISPPKKVVIFVLHFFFVFYLSLFSLFLVSTLSFLLLLVLFSQKPGFLRFLFSFSLSLFSLQGLAFNSVKTARLEISHYDTRLTQTPHVQIVSKNLRLWSHSHYNQ